MPRSKSAAESPRKTTTTRVRRAVKKTIVPRPAVTRKVTQRTYIFAVGRRKEAVARVRWMAGESGFDINGREMAKYFPTPELQRTANDALVLTEQLGKGRVSVRVRGGGINGQAEAVRLGIARALVKADGDYRISLKRAGFLRRDPRAKERKKYGLKRARRAPQWQKR